MAPTLVTSCTALPPEGAVLAWGGPALADMAPTLVTSCIALPPEGDAAPAARQSRFRGPCLVEMPLRSFTMSCSRSRGFTLIELLVAITIMALLAVLSWRGLDGMARAQTQTSQRADDVLALQAGLAQWKVDLDALTQTPFASSLDWDGRVLRLTRRTAAVGDGLIVVAWTRRSDAGGQWLRWQSPVLRTVGAWNDAWSRASQWAQNASTEDRTREVLVVPLEDWQIFYFRADAWTNPLSSDASQAAAAPKVPGNQPVVGPVTSQATVPEGIRLVLILPPAYAISGKLTLDWVRPTLSGDKS
jgi:general secretion pathway protein J